MVQFLQSRWLSPYLRMGAWVVGASLLPPIGLLTVSYFQEIAAARAAVHQEAADVAARVDRLLNSAEDTLSRLASDLDATSITSSAANSTTDSTAPSTPSEQPAEIVAVQRQLQRAVYTHPYFREAGIISPSGVLTFTSLGPVEPPIPISAGERSDPTEPGLQIIGIVRTEIMRERSLVLGLPTRGKGEVNVLVDPDLLFAERTSRHDGASSHPPIAIALRHGSSGIEIASSPPAFAADEGVITASARTQDGRVIVTATLSRAAAIASWHRQLAFGVPVTFACSLLVLAIFARVTRLTNAFGHDLQVGIANEELEVHYQPIIEIATGNCVGAEALVRWRHPERGLLLPSVFIPVAEETGAICELGAWVARRAIRDLETLRGCIPQFYVSVNVSPRQLNFDSVNDTFQLLSRHPSAPAGIVFEITETATILLQETVAADTLARLRGLGSAVSLDDFGTGYSSWEHLNHFRPDYLKLDRFYVSAIDRDSYFAAILDTLIDLGNRLQVTLVAEGVETIEQLQFLRDRGVCYAQGWLFSRPLPLNELEHFLANSNTES